MHANDVVSDAALLRGLIGSQFPKWAELTISALPPTGTDNLIYRLGDDLVVRMPRIDGATAQVGLDHEWLPRLAPHLPCRIPIPVAVGEPGLGYPFPWAVHDWIPGSNPAPGDHVGLAADLAAFVRALAGLREGPPSSRSGPLSTRDAAVRAALAEVADEIDLPVATAAWERAVSAPEHAGPAVWRHADLTAGNLLVAGDRLVAVLDWGPSGLGDPTVDLVPAWRLFRGTSRAVFREAVGADDAAWERARGWALSIALLELAYYRTRNPALADAARVALGEILA